MTASLRTVTQRTVVSLPTYERWGLNLRSTNSALSLTETRKRTPRSARSGKQRGNLHSQTKSAAPGREQRIQQFIAKADAQAPTLDDLTPDQRRDILLDLHPDIRIGPPHHARYSRISVLFALSAEAASHTDDYDGQSLIYHYSGKDENGNEYTVGAIEGWPPTWMTVDENGEPYFDFSNVSVDDVDENPGGVVEPGELPPGPASADTPRNLPARGLRPS